MLLARALSPEQLGHWSLALAVQGYALHLGEFGLRAVVTTEAAPAGRHLPELLARYLRLRLALTALALAVVLGGCALWRPNDLPLVALVTLPILPIALQLDWMALVDDRVGLAAVLLLVRPLAFVALLVLWRGRLDLYLTGACFLASWTMAAAASWMTLRRPATNHIGSVSASSLMLRRGGRLATVTVTNQLQLNADLVAIGWTVGAAGAGNYWLASQVLVAGLLFANAAGQVALARMPVLVGDRDRFGHAVEGEMARILCLAVPAAAVAAFASPWLLPPLFGEEHAVVASVLLWLLPWFVLQHPTTVLQAALTAAGRETCVLRANLVAVTVLLPALAVAAATSSLAAFALARSFAEAARLAVLVTQFNDSPRAPAQTSISA